MVLRIPMDHNFSDKDIIKTEVTLNFDETPASIELTLDGTSSLLLTRADVIALAKEFDIIRLI
jgi:uncharacterized lipoprotein NlpE involved in copper resistance